MSVTLVGWVLLPVGVLLALLPSRRPLLYTMVFFVPFTATAVVNVEAAGFGFQPAYYLGALWIGRVAVDRLAREGGVEVPAVQGRVLLGLGGFVLLAALSVTLVPWYGPGIEVLRPSGEYAPLRFTSQNVTQLLYLVYSALFVYSLAAAHLRPSTVRTGVRVLLASGLFVALWGWLQLAMYRAGLPYPDFLFNNNESFAQLFGQRLAGLPVKRMSSVAPEPSMLARFLLVPTSFSLYAWVRPGQGLLLRRWALPITFFFATTLALTTSSTAFVGLLGVAAVVGGYALWRRPDPADPGPSRRRLLGALGVLGVGLPLLGLLIARWQLGIDISQVRQVLELLLLEKLETTSGQVRLSTARHALSLFAAHPVLGIGWGSFRSFDLVTNVLVGTGLLGGGALAVAHGLLLLEGGRLTRWLSSSGLPTLRPLPVALGLTLTVVLLGKAVAEPGLAYLDHWLLFGLLLACLGWPARLATFPAAAGGEPDVGKGMGGVRG